MNYILTTKKRRWFWFLLFIILAVIVISLWTGWNVALVRDYHRMLLFTHDFSLPGSERLEVPWITLTLGTLCFLTALSGTILFFVRLLREMRLNQLQSEFVATVSHELKTPIATIELTSSMIQAGGLSPEEDKKLWKSHDEELRRLREQVDALLEAAQWQSRPAKMKRKAIRLEDWLKGSMERWQGLLGPNGKLVRKGVPLNMNALLDERSLDLVASNLVSNAQKFSKDQPYLLIRTRKTPGRWEIQFHDHGWGFEPGTSKKIFTRFFRAQTDAPYAIAGTGLGLFLASSACKAMGIQLKGFSQGPGKGAVFTLEGKEYKK